MQRGGMGRVILSCMVPRPRAVENSRCDMIEMANGPRVQTPDVITRFVRMCVNWARSAQCGNLPHCSLLCTRSVWMIKFAAQAEAHAFECPGRGTTRSRVTPSLTSSIFDYRGGGERCIRIYPFTLSVKSILPSGHEPCQCR
jgi:hypothetical protein